MHHLTRSLRARTLGATLTLIAMLAVAVPSLAAGAGLHSVVGSVHAHGPVRGAEVKLLDGTGAVIPYTTTTTDVNGLFVIDAESLPTSISFISSGGRDRGGRIIGSMVNYHPVYVWGDPVAINPATTLVDTYRRANKGMTHSRANARVHRYLGLPKGVDLGVDLRNNDSEFHGAAFLKAAGRAPQRHARRVVRDITAGRTREYLAVRRVASVKAAGDVTAAEFQPTNAQLVSGMSALANFEAPGSGAVVGGVLGAILGPDPDPTQIKLDAIIAQLNAVQTSVNEIIAEQYRARVSAEYNTYNAGVAPYNTAVDDTHDGWNAYTNVVLLRSRNASADEVASATRHFMDFYDGTAGSRAHRDDMVGYMSRIAQDFGRASAASGYVPLRDWNTAVLDENRFVTIQTQQSIAAASTYWRTIEAQLLIMNIEYAVQRPDLALPYRDWIGQYGRTASGAEGSAIAPWEQISKVGSMEPIDSAFIYDQASGRFWSRVPSGETTYFNSLLANVALEQRGSPLRMATSDQHTALFARSGSWPSMSERGYSDGRQYLVDQGWDPAVRSIDGVWVSGPTKSEAFGVIVLAPIVVLSKGTADRIAFKVSDQLSPQTANRLLSFPKRAGVDKPVPE